MKSYESVKHGWCDKMGIRPILRELHLGWFVKFAYFCKKNFRGSGREVATVFKKTKIYGFLSWVKMQYLRYQEEHINKNCFRYFGENASVSPGVKINKPERVILKEGACIQAGTIINSMGGLYVGRYSGISYNCVIFTVDHRYRNADAIPFDNHVFLKPVIIRDFVWIGANVKIMPGVEIGEGAIVGMGAVVVNSVKTCSIVVGNPAKIVGFRNKEQFEVLKAKGDFSLSRFQGNYEEILFPLSKRRFPRECEELGLVAGYKGS